MTRLWISVVALGGAMAAPLAHAQPAPADATAPTAPTPPPPRAPRDVVVTAKRAPPKCPPKDTACLTVVATELWKRYPKQIEAYCFRQVWAVQQNRQNKEDFFSLSSGSALPDTHDSYAFADELPPGLKFVCDYKLPKSTTPPAQGR